LKLITASPRSFEDVSGLEPLHVKSGWIIALGVVYIIAGIVVLSSVVPATVTAVFVVGITMVIAGVAEAINAVPNQDLGRVPALASARRSLYTARFLTFGNPLLAAAILTLFLGISIVASGTMRIALAFGTQQAMPWSAAVRGHYAFA
jgi:uncharacterized membrane protein HdeD (DUF308 family)